MEKEKRLGSKLFSNCYKMNATMLIPYDELIKLKQVNYCDLDNGILKYNDLDTLIEQTVEYAGNTMICETNSDSSIVLDFERKIFILNAHLEFKELSLEAYTREMLNCTQPLWQTNFVLCMQKEDIPYIKELLYYKLRKNNIFLKIDDSIIAQYDAACMKF